MLKVLLSESSFCLLEVGGWSAILELGAACSHTTKPCAARLCCVLLYVYPSGFDVSSIADHVHVYLGHATHTQIGIKRLSLCRFSHHIHVFRSSFIFYPKHRLSIMASTKQVLLDRIGGEGALELAVEKFYEKNVAHDDVARFFEGVDMKLLKAHQFKFMKLAFTEIPEGVDVAGMLVKGHSRLWDMGLNEKHFDVIATNLVETMQELGVAADVIDDAVAVVGPLRSVFEEQANIRAQINSNANSNDLESTKKSKKQVLLDRIGGEGALELAVEKFYEKNVAHDDVARFFEGVDMKLLKAHQFKFMKLAFTEIPEGVDVAGMLVKGHSRLWDMGLNEKHFDVIATNLVETMQELGVAADVIDDAVAVVGPLRSVFEEQANKLLA
jgi:hemoglobin